MFVCVCNAITEGAVQAAVADGAHTLSDLQGQLGVATCCGACADLVQEYLPRGAQAQTSGTMQTALLARVAQLAPAAQGAFETVAVRRC